MSKNGVSKIFIREQKGVDRLVDELSSKIEHLVCRLEQRAEKTKDPTFIKQCAEARHNSRCIECPGLPIIEDDKPAK